MILPNPQKGLTHIVTLVLVVVAIIGSFLVFNLLNKPAQVKEKTSVIQPLFLDLKHSIEDVGEHLKDTPSGDDTDSSERYATKGKGLTKTAVDNLEKVKPLVEKLSLSETSEYKKKLEEYISKSEELIRYEKDDIKISDDYHDPKSDYEEMTKSISGISSYMYSNPAKYVKEVSAAIEKEDEIIKDFEKLDESGLYKKYHEEYIKSLKLERELLAKARDAVENRDDAALAAATKKYSQDAQDLAKDMSRYADEIKEKYEGVIKDLKVLADKVETDYTQLQGKYNF